MLPSELLVYELRRQWQTRRMIVAAVVQLSLLLIFFLLFRSLQFGRPLHLLFYALVGVLLLASPPIAAIHLSPRHQATGLATAHVLLAKWIGSVSRPFLFLLLTEFLWLPLLAGIHWSTLLVGLQSLLLLSSCLAFGAALGLLCRLACSRLTYAVQLAYAIIGLFLSNVFWFLPLVSNNLSRWIPVVLQLNPFVALSAILHTDLFWTPYLYDVSRVTDYAYAYPKWYWTCLWFLASAVAALALACWVSRFTEGNGTENLAG